MTTTRKVKNEYSYIYPCGRTIRETRKAGYNFAVVCLSTTGVWWTVGLRASARSAASLAASCPSGVVLPLTIKS